MKLQGQITSLNLANSLSNESYITVRVSGCVGMSQDLSIKTKNIGDYKLGQLMVITAEVDKP
jgi:hypothetical protein